MKGLGQFRQFNWAGFSEGKTYQVVGISDWLDRDTGKRLGKRVDVVIIEDNTPYEYRSGTQYTNLYERLTFKVEHGGCRVHRRHRGPGKRCGPLLWRL